MRLPIANKGTVRAAGYGILLALALIVPTFLGFAIASGAESSPPRPGEPTATPSGLALDSPPSTSQQQVVSEIPVGDAPSTAEEALTRQDNDVAGIPLLRYSTPATGEIRLENGDVIPLSDDVRLVINLSPYPPNTFDVAIDFSVTQNGEPITDAVIDTVWDMIVMGHGPFETQIPHVSDGTYSASYDFFMFGPWQLDVEIQIPGTDPIAFAISIYVWPI